MPSRIKLDTDPVRLILVNDCADLFCGFGGDRRITHQGDNPVIPADEMDDGIVPSLEAVRDLRSGSSSTSP